ncbi:dimethylarginine dimethylaminohydrolase family protein [Shimazuella alba]|uniref:N(G),N(G)-dimethylarginine dimethylaminohydrolase n=1 Tax=Shimazuella alba TaxID=2690964 RepID=A0A6I4VPR5_9BACL|nr:arginine deiminase family protein [Shimazuella alba]MXQ52361.1 N(G),N(G)-dimethylarginine dimethylaminohydrolase [Shimazuella alba]
MWKNSYTQLLRGGIPLFSRAIVKKISKSYVNGLTTSNLGKPDYDKAVAQHEQYVEALKKCGLEVIVLEADESFPDSTFVEDTAVLTSNSAIITNPGAESRNGEIKEIREVVKKYYDKLEEIQSPGFLDGGDVLQIDDHFYVGLSARTNREGAEQFAKIQKKYGYETTIVPLEKFFHLKTGVAYLGNKDLVVAGEFVDHLVFNDYNKIVVEPVEEYAANCIRINDYVVIPKGFGDTKQKIEAAGYTVIELDMSEIQKQDGGLSCLSLRF